MYQEAATRLMRLISRREIEIKQLEQQIKEVELFFATAKMPDIIRDQIESTPVNLKLELDELKRVNKISNKLYKLLRKEKRAIVKITHEAFDEQTFTNPIYMEETEGVLTGVNYNILLIYVGSKIRGQLKEVDIDMIDSLKVISDNKFEVESYLEGNL